MRDLEFPSVGTFELLRQMSTEDLERLVATATASGQRVVTYGALRAAQRELVARTPEKPLTSLAGDICQQ